MTLSDLIYNLAGPALCLIGLAVCFSKKLRPAQIRPTIVLCCALVPAMTLLLIPIGPRLFLPMGLVTLMGVLVSLFYFGYHLRTLFSGSRPLAPTLLLAASIWDIRIMGEIMAAC